MKTKRIKTRIDIDIYNQLVDIASRSYGDFNSYIARIIEYHCDGWDKEPYGKTEVKRLTREIDTYRTTYRTEMDKREVMQDQCEKLQNEVQELLDYKEKYYSLIKAIKI